MYSKYFKEVEATRLGNCLDKTGAKEMEVPWVMSRFGMDNGVGSYVIFTHI